MNSRTRLPASNQGSAIYKLDEFEQLPDFSVPFLTYGMEEQSLSHCYMCLLLLLYFRSDACHSFSSIRSDSFVFNS